MSKIPPSVIGVSSRILADRYTHAELDSLFLSSGFPGDPPTGNKMFKCQNWMRTANNDCTDALERFGRLIAEFMDEEDRPKNEFVFGQEVTWSEERERIRGALGKEGLTYMRGGAIVGASIAGPSQSLAERLQKDGVSVLQDEYQRAYAAVEADPPAAVTAACAILESVCKTYLDLEHLKHPAKQTLGPLWKSVSDNLGLNPGQLADDDLKRILQGLNSVADGIGALRTHEGSAHGKSETRSRYRIRARHARLAVHAAHTMALFVLETWEDRRNRK